MAAFVLGYSGSGARIGTAQDMTFAIPLGFFIALGIAVLFWLRSGHERASRELEARDQLANEQAQRRSRVFAAHEEPAGQGEALPR